MRACVRACMRECGCERECVCGYRGVGTSVCVQAQCVRECTRFSDRNSHCIMYNVKSDVVIEANPIMSRERT